MRPINRLSNFITGYFDHCQETGEQWDEILRRQSIIYQQSGFYGASKFTAVLVPKFMNQQRCFLKECRAECKSIINDLEDKSIKKPLGDIIRQLDKAIKHDNCFCGIAQIRDMLEDFADVVFDMEAIENIKILNDDLI